MSNHKVDEMVVNDGEISTVSKWSNSSVRRLHMQIILCTIFQFINVILSYFISTSVVRDDNQTSVTNVLGWTIVGLSGLLVCLFLIVLCMSVYSVISTSSQKPASFVKF
jgi:hypothetical protein